MRKLSPRQTEILALFDQGLELKEIASQLEISLHTVTTHARIICQKTGCNTLRRAAWLRRTAAVPSMSN